MTTKRRVLLIATLDTKKEEARYLRQKIEAAGLEVIHLDPSIRQIIEGGAEIGPEAVAAAADHTIQQVRDLNHEGKCQEVMTKGSVACALATHKKTPLSGIIAIGGSMGTSLGTAVMRAFPYGLPKLMISTMTSGYTKGFIGSKDLIMMNPVCDIAGINRITQAVYRNGAAAIAGMALNYEAIRDDGKPLALISTLGTTEAASRGIRQRLEDEGFEVMVFHTLGTGGMVLDEIAAERDVAVVIDLSLVEINDYLNDGLCSAGPERGKAAIAKGIPTIFVPGNIDFMVAGPIDDAKARFPGKRYHIHNVALTAVRTEAPELRQLADHMAGIIKESPTQGNVSFFVPLGGFSEHDSPRGHLHDPSLPPVFASYLKESLPEHVNVVERTEHINDKPFAEAVADHALRLYHEKRANKS